MYVMLCIRFVRTCTLLDRSHDTAMLKVFPLWSSSAGDSGGWAWQYNVHAADAAASAAFRRPLRTSRPSIALLAAFYYLIVQPLSVLQQLRSIKAV